MKDRIVAWTFFILLIVVFASPVSAQQQLNLYFQKQDGQEAGLSGRLDFTGPVSSEFQWPAPAKTAHNIALLVPQLSDTWQTFAFAVSDAAEKLNLNLTIYSAESYLNLGLQMKQLRDARHQDGIILSAIDSFKMARVIDDVAKDTPIVGYANEVYAEGIAAKAMVYYHDVTYELGNWIRDHIERTKPTGKIRIALVMGPKGAGWSRDMMDGFVASLTDDPELANRLEFVSKLHGHTKPRMQERLVRVVLKNHENIDYLFGTAPAIERAAAIRGEFRERHPRLKLIAPYINADLYETLQNGEILVAASDNMISIGQIAVVQLLRLIRGETPDIGQGDFPYVTGPKTHLITQENAASFSYEALFGPRNFKPEVNVK